MVIYMDRFGKARALTISAHGRRRALAPASRNEVSGPGPAEANSSGGPDQRLPDVCNGVGPGGLIEHVRALASQI